MCKVLKISRTVYYYERLAKKVDTKLENLIIKIFNASRKNYGTRKIRMELRKHDIYTSRRKIARIMAKHDLISRYTVKQYKITRSEGNNDSGENIVNREFDDRAPFEVIVSDLTYVNVAERWNYICILLDLHGRKIVGQAAGRHKDGELIYKAFTTVQVGLNKFEIFHTDRRKEFKNKRIDELLDTFGIKRSLSEKGTPYDNAVAEATFKIIKTEFAFNRKFNSLEELERELFDYVNWYNNFRIHGSLGYLMPNEYRQVSI